MSLNGAASCSADNSPSSNSSKVKLLLRRDILNHKSASVSGSYSHSLARGSDKSNTPPLATVRSRSVDCDYCSTSAVVRLRKKRVKRIDVLSSSPVKSAMAKCLTVPGDSSSDSEVGTISSVTWGSLAKTVKCKEDECFDVESEIQSIQEVSRHRQSESRHNTMSSVITDTNSSTSVVDSEVSLTQQLQSINDLSPAYSVEMVIPPSVETPKQSIKFVIPEKETPRIRLDPPLPPARRGSLNPSQSPRTSASESIVSTPTSLTVPPSICSQTRPMLPPSVLDHTQALLQRVGTRSISLQPQPSPDCTEPQISLPSQKQEECQRQLKDSRNPTNLESTELIDSVLDSSELEEVKKIEEQIQKELSVSLKEESDNDLDLIRVADELGL